jgi:hypothetical protein
MPVCVPPARTPGVRPLRDLRRAHDFQAATDEGAPSANLNRPAVKRRRRRAVRRRKITDVCHIHCHERWGCPRTPSGTCPSSLSHTPSGTCLSYGTKNPNDFNVSHTNQTNQTKSAKLLRAKSLRFPLPLLLLFKLFSIFVWFIWFIWDKPIKRGFLVPHTKKRCPARVGLRRPVHSRNPPKLVTGPRRCRRPFGILSGREESTAASPRAVCFRSRPARAWPH